MRTETQANDHLPAFDQSSTVLVVEDESTTRIHLRAILQHAQYEVLEADSGEKGIEVFREEQPCAVILDIMLPGMDGFEVCKQIRNINTHTAILILTCKDQDKDKIYGLKIGADDYMVKPFNPDELIARLKAILRRSASQSIPGNMFTSGSFQIDPSAQRCFKGKNGIDLTHKETALLMTFFKNPGQILSRDELSRGLWGKDHFGSDKAIDVYIRKLREKLEDCPSQPVHLKTVWGTGYVWESDPET